MQCSPDDMHSAKKESLMALIREMQKLMAEDHGDKPMDLGKTLQGVEEEVTRSR